MDAERSNLFDDAVETLAAIARVQRHLDEAWIVPECRGHATVACASCAAIDLRDKLQMFARELIEDQGIEDGDLPHGIFPAKAATPSPPSADPAP